MTFDGCGVVVAHCCEAAFVSEGDALPDAFFGEDEVGHAFADLGHAGEGGEVADGQLEEDVRKDFFWDLS